MNFRVRFLVILLISGSLFSIAQSTYSYNLNIESGLSNNFVRTIFKDSQGLMWFGTDTGLDRFDGLKITNYAKRFKTPLKGAVQSIVEYKKGILIVGTSWGAFQYNIQKNLIIPIDFGIPSIDVRYVFISSKNKILFATERGLFTLNYPSLKAEKLPLKGKSNISLAGIIEDKKSGIWICGNEGLFQISPNNQTFTHTNIHPEVQNIRVSLLINKTIYLGTLRGLFAYNFETKSVKQIKGTENISIISLTAMDPDNIIIGTDNAGLLTLNFRNNKTTTENLPNQDNTMGKSIYALYYDNSKTLWTGTFDNGINFKKLQSTKRFNTIEFQGSANANIRSIYLDLQGEKYIGTRDGSIICLDVANKIKTKTRSLNGKNFRSNILTTIYPYPEKTEQLLIGTFGGGITVFNKKTHICSNFSEMEVFQKGTIYKFCTDIHHQLWIATLDGLYSYNPRNKTFIKINTTSATGSNEIFTIQSDNKDKIWIGTKTGVCYYSLSAKKIIQPKSCKLYRFQCTSTFVDSKGNAWFCFNKGGVLELGADLKEKLWLTKEIGLPENAPSSLVEDRNGNIWIGTSKGLFKVNKNNEVHTYGIEDGLTGIGFCPESAVLDSTGNLWWSNEKGLVTFINDKNLINNKIPHIIFTDFIINGNKYDVDTFSTITRDGLSGYNITLKGKSNNNLEFRVAALNYENARRNQYSFLLESVDKTWSKASSNPIIAYSELNPGNYILKIRASNNDDVWNPVPLKIRFSISPYFHETIWFSIIIWLIIGAITLYFTRNYISRMKSRIVVQYEDIKKKQPSATTLKITEQKGNEIKEKLLDYMMNEKPYLHPELRQADIANAIGYSVHDLSQVLNVQLNRNFSDFVNLYRVEEVKMKMQTEDAKKYTLTAIAMQCGFNAKSSFLRAFKKATNMTPTEYFKGIKVE